MIKSKDMMADLRAFVLREVSNPKISNDCANALQQCFGLNFRFQTIYVPTQTRRLKEIDQRNKAILDDFNGHNHIELAIKYQLSLQSIYNIIRTKRRMAETVENPLKPILLLVIDEYLRTDLINAGLNEADAKCLSQKIADYLCDNYAGAMFRTGDIKKDK